MAVAYVSDVDKLNVASGTSDAFTTFAVTGTNPTILIAVGMNSATASVSSVVLSAGLTGGAPYQVKQQRNTTTNVEIWAVPAPTGTGTLTVNYSASVPHQCNAAVLQGVDQTTPAVVSDSVSTTGSTSPLTLTPTNLTANDAVYMCACQTVTGDSPHVNSGTQVEILFGDSTTANAAAGYRLGTGSVQATWAVTALTETFVAVRVQAPTSAPTVFPASTLMMMGVA